MPPLPNTHLLARARVLVVGAGGLGCPAAMALARSGVGRITLIDPDRVELTNLHRQLLHRTADVGRPKVASATERLRAAFPEARFEGVNARLDEANAESLFRAHELVVDGTDGMETKYLLSDVAQRTRVPSIFGGVVRWEGQALVIHPEGPCLRCLYEQPPDPGALPTCAGAGVLGAMTGVVGALQAELACRTLRGEPTFGRLWRMDGRSLAMREARVERLPGCPAHVSAEAGAVPTKREGLA